MASNETSEQIKEFANARDYKFNFVRIENTEEMNVQALPVAFAVFTPYKYDMIWSFTSILSYAAYKFPPVHENLWLVGSGYIFMISYALYEWKKKQKTVTNFV